MQTPNRKLLTFNTLSEYKSGKAFLLIVARQSAASKTPLNKEHPATTLIAGPALLLNG
jgi:hypothetical protein